MTYRLIATRETAALYLAWELGVKRANEILHDLTPLRGSLIDLNHPSCRVGLSVWSKRRGAYGIFTKRDAERAACKIVTMAMYQQGRLHRPATALCVVEQAS